MRFDEYKKTQATAYHPQCDGLVEGQNHTLENILSDFVSEHSVDWDEWLDQAVFAYKSSVHESTDLSPYELIFGRPARIPIEMEFRWVTPTASQIAVSP